MTRKAYLTDLDGTLLRSDASLSTYTIETITELLHGGVPISFATARSYLSSVKVASAIPWTHPLVLYNGALLYDPVARSVLDGYWLDAAASNRVIRLGRDFGVIPLLFALTPGDDEAVLHEPLVRTGDRQFYASRPNDPRFRELRELVCPPDYKTLILTFIGTLEELEPLRAELHRQFGSAIHMHLLEDIYLKPSYFLEVSHAKANKKEGLCLWAQRMSIEPCDITVFGDNLNDLGMFEAAGTGMAVKRAHDRLKAIASGEIASNDEDAVARYIWEDVRQAGGMNRTLGA